MGKTKKTSVLEEQKVSKKTKKTPIKKEVKKFKSKKKSQHTKIEISKELILAIFIILFGIIVVIGTTYAAISTLAKGNKTQSVVAGTFKVKFTEGEHIQLNNAYPINDAKGLATTPYTFTIENTGTIDAMYRIKLEEDTTNPKNMVLKDKIKVSYKKGTNNYTTPQLLSSLEGGLVLVTDATLLKNEKVSYEIKMWIDESAGNEIMGKNYKTKVVVEAVQKVDKKYQDTIPPVVTLNGEENISLTKGSSYTEPGVKSIVDDTDGTIATSNVTKKFEYYNGTTTTTVSNIDTSKKGVYYITYQATDNSGNKGLAVRTITINNPDVTPPTLTLSGSTSINLTKGQSYNEPGYTATDSNDGPLTDRVVVTGTPINKVGSYVIKYIVMDHSGNFASKTRTVTVLLPTPTDASCFTFSNESITDYKCVSGNSEGLPAITDVVIPETIGGVAVTEIGYTAFQGKELTSVVISNNVTTISDGAFYNNQLTSVVIPDSVTTISNGAFSNNQLTNVIISNSVKEIGSAAFELNRLKSVVIPDGVTMIKNNAFKNNQLTNVVIANSVELIEASAFAENQLTSVTIPNSVIFIGSNAFSNNQLTSVVIPSRVMQIADMAFQSNRLTSVTIKGKSSDTDFDYYDNANEEGGIWGWAEGYSDANITWNG